MARSYDFINGPETSTLPTVANATTSSQIPSYGQIQNEFTARTSFDVTVTNLAALKALNSSATWRADNQLVFLAGSNLLYKWSGSSTSTSDDDTVVRPTDVANDTLPGRWLKIALGGGASSGGTTDPLDVLISRVEGEKFRGLFDPMPNSLHNSFASPLSTYKCYLMEDYTSGTTNIKLAVNPLFPNSADEQCDSTSGWTGTQGTLTASSVAGEFKTGTASLKLVKTAGATASFVSRTVTSMSVYDNSYLYFWLKTDSSIAGTLSNILIRCGVDSSNYRQWTTTVDYAGTTVTTGWNLMRFDISDTTGSTTTGSGWTNTTALSYFAVGVTTDASGDTPTNFFDAIFFADSSGKYAAIGDELTIYNATNRDTFVIDSTNTRVSGSLTLAASMSNTYTAVSATLIKRQTLTTAGDGTATLVNGLSGNIAKTQEIRLRRILPSTISGSSFEACTSIVTGEYFFVTAVNSGVSIVLSASADVSANWKSGRVVEVAAKYGNGNADYDYAPRGEFTMTGDATYSGTSLTLPMTTTTGIAVGDLVMKKQVACSISLATAAGNESFTAMTKDRIEIVSPGVPYPQAGSVWAHWTLSGDTGKNNAYPGGGTSSGLALTQVGTLTTKNPFNNVRFSTGGWGSGNYYYISAANSQPIDGNGSDMTDMAVSIWFNPTAFTGTQRIIFQKLNSAATLGYKMMLANTTNTLTFVVNTTSTNVGTFNPGVWNHLYLYWASANANAAAWLNGVKTSIGSIACNNSADIFGVGIDQAGTGNPATGVNMSDMVIWRNPGAALSDYQINAIYNKGNPTILGPGAGFKYRWSKTGLTGQKLSLKAVIDRAADTDTPYLWSMGAVKSS